MGAWTARCECARHRPHSVRSQGMLCLVAGSSSDCTAHRAQSSLCLAPLSRSCLTRHSWRETTWADGWFVLNTYLVPKRVQLPGLPRIHCAAMDVAQLDSSRVHDRQARREANRQVCAACCLEDDQDLFAVPHLCSRERREASRRIASICLVNSTPQSLPCTCSSV